MSDSNCKYCYGKGYATQLRQYCIVGDFPGDITYTSEPEIIKITCKCQRKEISTSTHKKRCNQCVLENNTGVCDKYNCSNHIAKETWEKQFTEDFKRRIWTFEQWKTSKEWLDRLIWCISSYSPHNLWKARDAIRVYTNSEIQSAIQKGRTEVAEDMDKYLVRLHKLLEKKYGDTARVVLDIRTTLQMRYLSPTTEKSKEPK